MKTPQYLSNCSVYGDETGGRQYEMPGMAASLCS